MDPQESIRYLQLIREYLDREWLVTRDPEIAAEIEHIATEIAELERTTE